MISDRIQTSEEQLSGTSDPVRVRVSLLKRPVFWAYALMVAVTLLFAVRHFVFVPVSCEAMVEPRTLMPGESQEALIRLQLYNRAGFSIPGQSPRFRCSVDEGAHLVTWRYRPDSAAIMMKSIGGDGMVVLRLVTRAWPFPVYVEVPIAFPRA